MLTYRVYNRGPDNHFLPCLSAQTVSEIKKPEHIFLTFPLLVVQMTSKIDLQPSLQFRVLYTHICICTYKLLVPRFHYLCFPFVLYWVLYYIFFGTGKFYESVTICEMPSICISN
jgi:hypothetical protein